MNTWKRKVSLALAGFSLMLLGRGAAQAAASADISVVVQVQVVSVSVATTTWAITETAATPGSVFVSSAIAVTNNGNTQEDYRLSLAEQGVWNPSTADATAGSNEFALLALFTDTPAASVNDDMFNDGGSADDVITTSAQTATNNLYSINANGVGEKGYDVAQGGLRSLFLDFRTPTSNTIAATQYITVTVTAIAG